MPFKHPFFLLKKVWNGFDPLLLCGNFHTFYNPSLSGSLEIGKHFIMQFKNEFSPSTLVTKTFFITAAETLVPWFAALLGLKLRRKYFVMIQS